MQDFYHALGWRCELLRVYKKITPCNKLARGSPWMQLFSDYSIFMRYRIMIDLK